MMRIDLAFDRPLSRDQRTSLLLAVGALAKTRRVRFLRGDYRAVVFGEALGVQTVLDALAAEQLVPASAVSSLDPDSAAQADESPERRTEAVRAIGR